MENKCRTLAIMLLTFQQQSTRHRGYKCAALLLLNINKQRPFWVQKAITECRNSEKVYREATLWAATYLLVLTKTERIKCYTEKLYSCANASCLSFHTITKQMLFASGGKESSTLAKPLLLNTGLYISIPFLKTNIIHFLVLMHASSFLEEIHRNEII